MKYLSTLLLLLSIIISSQNIKAQSETNPWNNLPANINGWVPAEVDRIYHEDDLFDYIDGGAELFLSFGFNQVFNRIYACAGQPDIYVDIFEMTSSYNAYGVFTLSTEKPGVEFGQGSQYTQGAILFWKDKYFVSIITSPETPEAKEVVFEIAKLIDNEILHNGELPLVLNYLPQENLEPGSIRYFRHHHWQNSHLYLAYENIFNIDQTMHCVSAKYNFDGKKTVLLLIDYPDELKAKSAYDKYVRDFIPELGGKTYVQREDGSLTGAKLFGKLLAVVFKATNVEVLMDLIDSVESRFQE